MDGGRSWSTQQLVEFVATVSSFACVDSAVRGAVERAAEALEAEVGAVLTEEGVPSSVGFPAGDVPVAALRALAESPDGPTELPGLGPCRAAIAPLESGSSASLIVARLGDEGIVREVQRVNEHAEGAPIAGFYSYGEIARTAGVAGFHNQTIVVLAVG